MNPKLRFAAATVIGMAGAGVVYWPVPYDDLELLARPLLLQWVGAGAVAGLVGRLALGVASSMTVAAVATGFGIAVTARVVLDGFDPSTSHNLFGIELLFALAAGALGGAVGALAGQIGIRPSGQVEDGGES